MRSTYRRNRRRLALAAALRGLAVLALAWSLPACSDEGGMSETREEVTDELEDTKEEIEDEVDDMT